MRWLYFGCLSAVLLMGCGKKPAGPDALGPVEVSTVKVTRQDAPVSYEFVGQTQSSAQVQIVARVDGFLDERVYKEGSVVKAGDVMFRQDPKPFQATLDSARAALALQQARWEVARDNLARVQPLVQLNALAQKDLDDAVGMERSGAAAVEMAKADVERAELNLGYTTIQDTGLRSIELRPRQCRLVHRPAATAAHRRLAARSDLRQLQHVGERHAALSGEQADGQVAYAFERRLRPWS